MASKFLIGIVAILASWSTVSLADGGWGQCQVKEIKPGMVIDGLHVITCTNGNSSLTFTLNRKKGETNMVQYETCLKFATLSLLDKSLWFVTSALINPESGPLERNDEAKDNLNTMCGIVRR